MLITPGSSIILFCRDHSHGMRPAAWLGGMVSRRSGTDSFPGVGGLAGVGVGWCVFGYRYRQGCQWGALAFKMMKPKGNVATSRQSICVSHYKTPFKILEFEVAIGSMLIPFGQPLFPG